MHLGGDFRYAARQLWKAPGFAVLALAALALGIGATTAIFSVVDTVLLKPLPFREPGRLLALWEKDPALGRDRNYVAPVNFLEWRNQSRTVETMAAIQNLRVNIGGGSGEGEEVKAERVSAALFPLLGVQPMLGRAFQDHEDQPGAAKVAIIGHSLWQRRFGSDRLVIGKSLRVRDGVYTIVGVLGSGFTILEPGVDVWMPLVLKPADPLNNGRYVAVIGRRRANASLQQVRREMEIIGEQSERALPEVNTGWRPSIFGLQEEMVFDVRRPLWVLMGACSLLLLMACANVANLLLVRGSSRRKEIATRAALGAPRSRLIAQLLSESLILGLGGGLLGLILGGVAVAVVARFGPADVPRIAQASLDLRLFSFALAASVLSGILFGIVPALHGSRGDLSGALNEGGRGGSSGRAGRAVRRGLAVFEVAMAVVVLIASGLLIRSFIRLRSASPGFEPAGVLTMRIPLGGARNSTPEQRVAFTDLVINRIAAMPGVRSVGAVNGLPLNGLGNGADFTVEGASGPPSIRRPNGLIRSVTTGYFQTIRVPLIAGRFLTDADSKASKPVVLINQTLARQFFPNRDPLGKRMEVRTNDVRNVEIVGVVGDIKADRFETEDWPMIYNPNAQVPMNTASLAVRTAGPPAAMASAIAGEIRRIEPDQVVAEVRPMTEFVDRAIAGARFNTALLTTFAGIAFLLASVGIYGVISYEVTERTNEIGIRMALGAQPRDVLRLVMGQGARLAAAGIALGLVAAFWAARLMSAMLYGVEPDDAWTYGAISILLAAVALAASYLPSRRAMLLDPVAALRHG